jgi:alkyl sulfatase BDS1-like metallo-beta-lactamase superfamily hydrolase
MTGDFNDRTDFDNANRGFIDKLDPCVIKNDKGDVVWDNDSFAFLDAECPDTVNASLWRQSQLCAKQGLYQVTDGIFQVRGFDLSNMTLVEGTDGVIVIDPLISAECAAAALAIYRKHRGDRPVTGVIYTHPHIDHFGGVLGVIGRDYDVPIVAPEHFMDHAVSENIYAGVAMLRRGMYYSGTFVPRGPEGQVGMGLGQAVSTGSVGLIPPNLEITKTGQEETIDGVRMLFQMTPGTECPAEINFFFPERRALCMAENATHNLHNILTLRGAQVRDARMWARYLAEAVELFVDDTDVAFASHHWPTWERDNVERFIHEQRDLYAYLHDQTLRHMNKGLIGSEIAEILEPPPTLEKVWHTHGYYGSYNHNVKATYQRYVGWYDANPAHLWQHPPEALAARYVEAIGGVDATIAKVREYADAGDLRFAAELGSHAVFAAPDNARAKELLATIFERLAYGAENATWRNCYLEGAYELRNPIPQTAVGAGGMAPALSTTQLFDSVAIRIDGPRAWDEHFTITWNLTDEGQQYRMELSNGALVHWPTTRPHEADLTVTLTRVHLAGLLMGGKLEGVTFDGDANVLMKLRSLTDAPNPSFSVVTP